MESEKGAAPAIAKGSAARVSSPELHLAATVQAKKCREAERKDAGSKAHVMDAVAEERACADGLTLTIGSDLSRESLARLAWAELTKPQTCSTARDAGDAHLRSEKRVARKARQTIEEVFCRITQP